MAANNNYPTYNGFAPSWGDAVLTFYGVDLPSLTSDDIKGINTERSLEVGTQLSGGRVMKSTAGSTTNNASVIFYRSGFDVFMASLDFAARAQGFVRPPLARVGLVHFGIMYNNTPAGGGLYSRELKGVRYLGDTANGAEGTDADVVECKLFVTEIVHWVGGKGSVLL